MPVASGIPRVAGWRRWSGPPGEVRQHAAQLFAQDVTVPQIAAVLWVSPKSVYGLRGAWHSGGTGRRSSSSRR
jgi:hypothetical protein